MPSRNRRAAGRRRAWGRGPIILKFEPLEGRQLLSITTFGSGTSLGPIETTANPLKPTATDNTGTPASPGASTTAANSLETAANNNSDGTAATTSVSTTATPTSVSTTATPTSVSTTATPTSVSTTAATTSVSTTAATNSGAPDLVAVRFMGQSNLDWDQTFTAQIGVMNQGNAATDKPFTIDVYASPTLKLSQGAVKIGSIDVPAGLKPGQTFQFDRQLTTPQVPVVDLTRSPSYFLLLDVDSKHEIAESDESNNVNRGFQGVDASMVTVTPRLPSDLQAAGLTISPGSLKWGDTLHVKATILNNGQGNAPPTNARIVLSPAGQSPYSQSGYTIGTVAIPAINGHQSVTAEQDIDLPTEPPSALANIANFTVTLIADGDEVANPIVQPFQWRGQGVDLASLQIAPQPAITPVAQLPDLALTSIENPKAVAWGQTFNVTAKVQNDGATAAGPFKVRFLLLQGNGQGAPTLALGDAEIPSLAAGYTQDVVQTIKLPARVPDGLAANIAQGRIVAVVNPDHTLDESDLDNNTLASTPLSLRVVGSNGDSTPVVTVPNPPAQTPSNPQPQGGQQQTTNPPANPGPQAPNPGSHLTARQRRAAAIEARRARLQMFLQQRKANNRHGLHIYDGPHDRQSAAIPPALRILSIREARREARSGSGKPA